MASVNAGLGGLELVLRGRTSVGGFRRLVISAPRLVRKASTQRHRAGSVSRRNWRTTVAHHPMGDLAVR